MHNISDDSDKGSIYNLFKELGPGRHKIKGAAEAVNAVAYEYSEAWGGGDHPGKMAPVKAVSVLKDGAPLPGVTEVIIKDHEWAANVDFRDYTDRGAFKERIDTMAPGDTISLEYNEADLDWARRYCYSQAGKNFSVLSNGPTGGPAENIVITRNKEVKQASARSIIMSKVEQVDATGGKAVVKADVAATKYVRSIVYALEGDYTVSASTEGTVIKARAVGSSVRAKVTGAAASAYDSGFKAVRVKGGASDNYIRSLVSSCNKGRPENGKLSVDITFLEDEQVKEVRLYSRALDSLWEGALLQIKRAFPALGGAFIQARDIFSDESVLTAEGLEELKDYLIRAQNEITEEIYYLTDQSKEEK